MRYREGLVDLQWISPTAFDTDVVAAPAYWPVTNWFNVRSLFAGAVADEVRDVARRSGGSR